jgi:dTDP-4-dehydrorhamnose reductase
MRILVLGATGMLGNAAFRVFSERSEEVFGTARSPEARQFFAPSLASRLVVLNDVEDPAQLDQLLRTIRPEVVFNCISLRKAAAQDPMRSIAIYSVLPQRLARLCRLAGARLVQMSSDGVFSGTRGRYTEDDAPDATDVYGIAKLLGEVGGPHITLRTSIIGHELQTRSGLLEWFLSQRDECRAYARAIFSGFPTVVLARIIRDVILPRTELEGLYHLASPPISKLELLRLIAQRYECSIQLLPDNELAIDRSLVADRFARATGYAPPEWPELIGAMHSYKFGLART